MNEIFLLYMSKYVSIEGIFYRRTIELQTMPFVVSFLKTSLDVGFQLRVNDTSHVHSIKYKLINISMAFDFLPANELNIIFYILLQFFILLKRKITKYYRSSHQKCSKKSQILTPHCSHYTSYIRFLQLSQCKLQITLYRIISF